MFLFAHVEILCVLSIMPFWRRVTHLPDYIHILTSMQEGRAGGSEGVFNVMYVLHSGMVVCACQVIVAGVAQTFSRVYLCVA